MWIMRWMGELEIAWLSSLHVLVDSRVIYQPMERVYHVFLISYGHDPLTLSRFITFVGLILLYEYAEGDLSMG